MATTVIFGGGCVSVYSPHFKPNRRPRSYVLISTYSSLNNPPLRLQTDPNLFLEAIIYNSTEQNQGFHQGLATFPAHLLISYLIRSDQQEPAEAVPSPITLVKSLLLCLFLSDVVLSFVAGWLREATARLHQQLIKKRKRGGGGRRAGSTLRFNLYLPQMIRDNVRLLGDGRGSEEVSHLQEDTLGQWFSLSPAF